MRAQTIDQHKATALNGTLDSAIERRYLFLVDFGRQHPLAIGRKAYYEMRRLNTALTGLRGNALTRAIAMDQKGGKQMVPNRATDAGPSGISCTCRKGDCLKHAGVVCCMCGFTYVREETVPCSGHDRCVARICHDCKSSQDCHECSQWACPEHIATGDDLRLCDICRADRYPEAEEVAAAARSREASDEWGWWQRWEVQP